MNTVVYAVTHTVTTPALTGEQITAGKLYRVLYETENSFDIIDDNGKQIPCFWQDCVFGDAWTRCEMVAVEPLYLVWSNEHKAWWGPDCRGYVRSIAYAGRYDRAKALSIAGTRGGGWYLNKGNPDEIAILEQDAIDQYADITRAQQEQAA